MSDISDYDDDIVEIADSDDAYKELSAKAKKASVRKGAAPQVAAPKAAAKTAAKGITKTKVERATKKKAPLVENNFSDDEAPAPSRKKAPSFGEQDDRPVEEIYQKKTQLEHILLRPDTYIGSTEEQSVPMWVFEDDRMVFREVKYVPGLYKIFDEIIVNAADNKVRDKTMDTIKVTITGDTISVWNNGRGIPVEMHAKEKVYVPELIFGHLLTSSNYDDDQKKITGGRNGYGAKLCNIFSTQFIVETADSRSGLKFRQARPMGDNHLATGTIFTSVHSNNMSKMTTPKIDANPKKEDYTQITFTPDLPKFGMTSLNKDFEALVKKRVYDLAGCLQGVKVYLNGAKLNLKGFKDYVGLYLKDDPSGSAPSIIYEQPNEWWEVAFAPSDGQFQQVSFVNSICTMKGGTHVNHVADIIVAELIEALKKKDKKALVLKPHQVKNHMRLFVKCHIVNPSFDSQTKENMTLKVSQFGSKCELSDGFKKSVLKSGVMDNILSFAKYQQDKQLKKSDGQRAGNGLHIPKLEDAGNAGTKKSKDCTLILTEGDSAKALVYKSIPAIADNARDYWGVFPLKGKLLNVREATYTQVANNDEINNIKKILGLQHKKEYHDVSSLRYGRLMIMTDQDHDGSHIKGLIVNFFDHYYPSLLKIPGFLTVFITPIVKVTKRDRVLSFYSMPDYYKWKDENDNGKGWSIKYFKGLGTNNDDDGKEYFSNVDEHIRSFAPVDDEDRELIDMAFSKKRADERKEWLRKYQPGSEMDMAAKEIKVSEFINKELILFSMSDNARSIPCAVDGFKPGHRKIMYACFKKNLKNVMKVYQLAGYVAEHTAYHHGEASLTASIVSLACDYVGSNNLPLLVPDGQFGSRMNGPKDAASARYINTKLQPIARAIFRPEDDALLKYLNEDGLSIEPDWYIPILPMLLVNGSEGIGTGWSNSIPSYNPEDIVDNILRHLDGKEYVPMHPWYRGFTGSIELVGDEKFKVSGTIEKIDETTVRITELPIRTWISKYKTDYLEVWAGKGSDKDKKDATEKDKAWVKDFRASGSGLQYDVTLTEENMALAEAEGLEKKFKLTSTISTTNLVCFDKEGRLKKFNSIREIFEDFCELREKYYVKRKEHMMHQIGRDLDKLRNQVRFVRAIVDGELRVRNRKRADLDAELRRLKYDPFPKTKSLDEQQNNNEDDDDNETSAHNNTDYDYLLGMPIYSLTFEKIIQLENQAQKKRDELRAVEVVPPNQLWRNDLEEFRQKWREFVDEANQKEMARQLKALGKAGKASKGTRAKPAPAARAVKPKAKAAEKDDEDVYVEEKPKKAAAVRKPRVKKESTNVDPDLKENKQPAEQPSVEDLTRSLSDLGIATIADAEPAAAKKKRTLGPRKTMMAPGQSKPGVRRKEPSSNESGSPVVSLSSSADEAAAAKPATTISKKAPTRTSRTVSKKVAKREDDSGSDSIADDIDMTDLANSVSATSISTSPPEHRSQKPAPVPKKTGAAKPRRVIKSETEDEDSYDPTPVAKKTGAAKPRRVIKSETEDEDSYDPAPVQKRGRAKVSRVVVSSSESEVEEEVVVVAAPKVTRTKRAAAVTVKKYVISDDDEDGVGDDGDESFEDF
ncbi:DNA topoisomerase 2 [Borealophlyctis nickersoniae]|nr:DNA topoisomerase 2 [Borealophlyctis nickersoniae]